MSRGGEGGGGNTLDLDLGCVDGRGGRGGGGRTLDLDLGGGMTIDFRN